MRDRVRVRVLVRVCVFNWVSARVCVCVFTRACICVRVRVCVLVFVCMYVCVYGCASERVCYCELPARTDSGLPPT